LLRRVVWWKFTSVSEVLTVSIIALMMEAARTSETWVKIYQTALRYNPEDSIFILGEEKLKSHKIAHLLGNVKRSVTSLRLKS
jgi:hypothetical protein